MALTQFVEKPEIRELYKAHAARAKLPFDGKAMEVVAPSCGQYHSSVGTAFDYLARFRMARDLLREYRDTDFTLYDTGWAAEDSVDRMAQDPKYRRHHERWSFLVAKARELFNQYVETDAIPVERVAKCCQYLANVDLLTRIGDFNPNFQPRDEVQAELIQLNYAFDPVALFRPRKACLLNPVFVASDLTDGADADLIIDNTIIDIKTTNEIAVSAAHIRQLAGYAVLQNIAGADLGNGRVYAEPCTDIAIYYSRYGVLAKWPLAQIFPNGFEAYADALHEQMAMEATRAPAPGMGR